MFVVRMLLAGKVAAAWREIVRQCDWIVTDRDGARFTVRRWHPGYWLYLARAMSPVRIRVTITLGQGERHV